MRSGQLQATKQTRCIAFWYVSLAIAPLLLSPIAESREQLQRHLVKLILGPHSDVLLSIPRPFNCFLFFRGTAVSTRSANIIWAKIPRLKDRVKLNLIGKCFQNYVCL